MFGETWRNHTPQNGNHGGLSLMEIIPTLKSTGRLIAPLHFVAHDLLVEDG